MERENSVILPKLIFLFHKLCEGQYSLYQSRTQNSGLDSTCKLDNSYACFKSVYVLLCYC